MKLVNLTDNQINQIRLKNLPLGIYKIRSGEVEMGTVLRTPARQLETSFGWFQPTRLIVTVAGGAYVHYSFENEECYPSDFSGRVPFASKNLVVEADGVPLRLENETWPLESMD